MRGSIGASAVVGAVLVDAVFAEDPDGFVVLEPGEARAFAEELRGAATGAEEIAREEDEAVAWERHGRPTALPDVELQGVRRELARVAERGAAKANALMDAETRSGEVRGWIGVARLALHARALTEEDGVGFFGPAESGPSEE